ncbi:MAG: hypothetical protein HQK77_21345 [Desulfobacterales bacterium]|nr:hypothetical protein [Desulfobacterales bacterium]
MDSLTIEKLIDDKAVLSWLTPSQNEAFKQIQMFDSPAYKMINLYGKSGIGKGFIARFLIKELGYSLCKTIAEDQWIKTESHFLIVDHVSTSRESLRSIRNSMFRTQIERILIISKTKADDDIPKITFELAKEDIEVFRSNLYKIGVKIPPDIEDVYDFNILITKIGESYAK